MPSLIDSGSHTATGAEDTVESQTVAKVYVAQVRLDNMISGDIVVLRGKTKVLTGGTLRTIFEETISDAQVAPDIVRAMIPVPSPHQFDFTLEQTAGSAFRAFEWHVAAIADVVVNASGTLAADGTEQDLATPTDNANYVLNVDLGNMLAGDSITLRIKVRTIVAGGFEILYEETFTDAAVVPDIAMMSVPFEAPLGTTVTLEQTAGVNRSYPFELVEVSNS